MFTSHNQLSRPGHEQWSVTESDVKTPAFGPNKSSSRPRATGSKQEREGGTILPSPTLLPGKLNLIDAYAATKHLAALLTAC